jgi:hypothetical protein
MQDYVKRLLALRKELEKKDEFVDVVVSKRPRASKTKIDRAEKQLGRPLPGQLKEFFSQSDGWRIEWKCPNMGPLGTTLTGQSQVYSVEQIVDHKVLTRTESGAFEFRAFWSKKISENKACRLARLKVLDDIGFSNYVLMELERDKDEPRLYLFTYTQNLVELSLSVSEYLETVLETRGLYLWQQYATTSGDPAVVYDDLFQSMATLFPGADTANLMPAGNSFAPTDLNELLRQGTKSDYKQRFDETEKRLEGKGVKVNEYARSDGASLGSLAKAAAALDGGLPREMVMFYSALNGLTLQWEGEYASGQIRMLPIEEVLGGVDGAFKRDWNNPDDFRNWIWHDHYEPEKKAFYQDLRPIESMEGMSVDVTVRFRPQSHPELIVIDEEGEHHLPMTFARYIEALLGFMGLDRWYYAFIGKEAAVVRNATLAEQMRRYFPDVDVKSFQVR